MVDAVSNVNSLPQFTTIKYTTKDGENVTVTKKDGVVTLVGDKNGVRQMPLDDFIKKELAQNVANINLEKTPAADVVELSKTEGKEVKVSQPVAQANVSEPKKLDVAA